MVWKGKPKGRAMLLHPSIVMSCHCKLWPIIAYGMGGAQYSPLPISIYLLDYVHVSVGTRHSVSEADYSLHPPNLAAGGATGRATWLALGLNRHWPMVYLLQVLYLYSTGKPTRSRIQMRCKRKRALIWQALWTTEQTYTKNKIKDYYSLLLSLNIHCWLGWFQDKIWEK